MQLLLNFLCFYAVIAKFPIQSSDLGPSNIRGYLYYPDFGPTNYSRKQLEVIFDYDVINVPKYSLAQIECLGYRDCSNPSTCGSPGWAQNKSTLIKPHERMFFDIDPEIDVYFCKANIQDNSGSMIGSWSDYGTITLQYDWSMINPKSSLVICQALKYPPTNYGKFHLIRRLDVDAANAPNETEIQFFDRNCNLAYNGGGNTASYQTPLCFDWIANWEYRLNTTDPKCLVKIDTLYLKIDIPLACYDAPILHLECYAPLNTVFFSTVIPSLNPEQQYRLYKYEVATNSTKLIVSGTGSVNSLNCDRPVTHFWHAFDWRPYWSGELEQQAQLMFISENTLWSYNIGNDECQQLMDLRDLGFMDAAQEIIQFDMDWTYFYWINSTSYQIHAYDVKNGRTKILHKLRILNAEKQELAHNLSKPIYDDLTYVTSLTTYTPAARVYPHLMECLIPDLSVNLKLSNATNAIVTLEKCWNTSELCSRTNRPPPQLKVICSPLDPEDSCKVGSAQYRGRDNKYTTDLRQLTFGHQYRLIIEVSIIGNEQLNKRFEQQFTAEIPSLETWKRDLIIATVVSCICVLITLTIFFLWYRKKKAMSDFLRRERIDSSQLTLIRILGEGEFGEVWLANYRWTKSQNPTNHHGPPIEVALKMRKSNNGDHKSTLISADCFFQEAVALNFLRHPNIIKAYGLCMNYKRRPPILVLEYMNGGSAYEYVKLERRHLVNADLAKICKDIIRACVHLAHLKVIHKDIGARNVLIKKNTHGKPETAKLTDFGLARDIGKKETVYATTNPQTIFHIRSTAPEGFEGKFSSKSDVWSFGVFVWELYSLIENDHPLPYSQLTQLTSESLLAFLKNGASLDRPTVAPSEVNILMKQCWSLDPNERPTFRQLNAAWRYIGNQPIDHKPLSQPDQADQADQNDNQLLSDNPKSIVDNASVENTPEIISRHLNGYVQWDGDVEKDECKPDSDAKILFQNFVGYKTVCDHDSGSAEAEE